VKSSIDATFAGLLDVSGCGSDFVALDVIIRNDAPSFHAATTTTMSVHCDNNTSHILRDLDTP
jgi:hypothetical protein